MTVGYLRDSKECKDLTFLTHFNGDLQGSDCISEEFKEIRNLFCLSVCYIECPTHLAIVLTLGKHPKEQKTWRVPSPLNIDIFF